jgi:hypothetical protein
MIRRFVLAAGLVLALAGSALAADKPPPIRVFDIPTIEKLGGAIYRQDRAAWLATDVLVDKVPDLKGAGIKGWIVEGEGDNEKVRFLRDVGSGLEAGYDIVVTAKGAQAVVAPADRSLTADERAAFAARQSAIAKLPGVCRQGYNSVVLKDVEGDGWLVWLLAPSPAKDMIPFGGHYRFSVSADGQTVNRVDALSGQLPDDERQARASPRRHLADALRHAHRLAHAGRDPRLPGAAVPHADRGRDRQGHRLGRRERQGLTGEIGAGGVSARPCRRR